MNNSIYQYKSYKAYLKALIKTNPKMGYGFRTRIAETLRCQTAYISQVLNKSANFTLEQAEELNSLFNHTKDEAYFFRLLVQLERAGSHKLKQVYKEEIQSILLEREKLKTRLEKTESLSDIEQTKYYSRWYFSAIHIICTIPKLRNRNAIIAALKLDQKTVDEAINFLLKVGLIEESKGEFQTTTKRLYIGSESTMVNQLHTNWRLKSIDSLDKKSEKDMHYSTCISLSHEDFSNIKDRLISEVNQIRDIVKKSNEEDMCCLSIDLFSLLNN